MIEEAVVTKIADLVFEKYRKAKEEKSVQLVEFPVNNLSYTELDSATSNNTEFDKDNPSIIIENPYKKTCLVKELSIIPDESFKGKGMVEICIDDEIIFRNKNAGNFAKIPQSEIILNRGKYIKSEQSIKAFLKSADGSHVGIALQVTFGD